MRNDRPMRRASHRSCCYLQLKLLRLVIKEILRRTQSLLLFLLAWANSVETSTSSYFLLFTSLMDREDCSESCFLRSAISLSLADLRLAQFRPTQLLQLPQSPRPPQPGPRTPLGQGRLMPQRSLSSQIDFFLSKISVKQHGMYPRRLLLLISETWASQLLLDISDGFVAN